jgi:hypothetical protein
MIGQQLQLAQIAAVGVDLGPQQVGFDNGTRASRHPLCLRGLLGLRGCGGCRRNPVGRLPCGLFDRS